MSVCSADPCYVTDLETLASAVEQDWHYRPKMDLQKVVCPVVSVRPLVGIQLQIYSEFGQKTQEQTPVIPHPPCIILG